jgi:hypothetical protein
MKAYKGGTVTTDVLVPNRKYDCATDCAALYNPDMPGSYIPTSKVSAQILKPLLEGK